MDVINKTIHLMFHIYFCNKHKLYKSLTLSLSHTPNNVYLDSDIHIGVGRFRILGGGGAKGG